MSISNILTQNYGKLAYIDILLVCFYLFMCLYIGAKNVGKIKNLKDYALGTGQISTAALVATIYASYLGAGATIGTIEKIAGLGLLFAITVLFNPVKWLLSIFIFAGNIDQFRGCITVSDIMYRLYGKVGRVITCLTNIVGGLGIIAAQAMAFGYCIHYFLEIPIYAGVLVGVATIIFYSVMGGIGAVVLTDMFQFGIFYVILPVICGLMIYQAGGYNAIIDSIPEEKISLNIDANNWSMFFGCLLYAIMPYNGAVFIQRFLMSKSSAQLKRVLWIVILVDISIALITCLLGFALISHITPEISTKTVLWHVLSDNLFSALKGVVVISVLAIIMSTADSYLNIIGVMIARDIFKQLNPKMNDNAELTVARFSTIFLGFLGCILALYGASILSVIWVAFSFSYSILTIPIAAGFLKFRTNATSFVVSGIFAVIGSSIGLKIQQEFGVFGLLFGLSASALGLFGAHYVQKALGILDNIAPQEKIEIQKWYEEQSLVLGVPPHEVPAKLETLAKLEEKHYQINYKDLYLNTLAFIKKCLSIRMQDLMLYSQRTVARYGEKYYELAFFGLIFCIYPLIFLHSTYELYPVADQHPMWYGSVVFRVFAALGCISIILQHRWQPENVKTYMPLYFHFMAMCILPALSTYSYLAFPDEHMLIGGIIAIFSLPLLVDWLTFSIIAPLGILLGHLTYMFIGYVVVEHQGMYEGTMDGSILYIVLAIAAAFVLHFIESKKTDTLYVKAHHDALTKLVNRHYLDEHLDKLIEDSHARNNPLSVVTLDIDHFKKVNDTYGHDVGDIVLQHLSKILSDSSRPLDICARLGGEEFMIVLPKTTLDEASYIAQRLREKIKVSEVVIEQTQNISLRYTVSIGVADLKLGYNQDILMKVADDALYEAKRLGRDRVEVASLHEKEMK